MKPGQRDSRAPTQLDDATPALPHATRRGAETGPTTPFDPGTLINGRYRVEECLGEGGMGVVYRVSDTLDPDRLIALKCIRQQFIEPQRIRRFKTEFRTLTDLRHPNLATAYDFEPIEDSGDYFFTMEFVDGSDLLRATEGMGWQTVVDYLVQVCRALSYVHCRKLIHYDIKPGNVMVDSAGRVKVLDFGLAAAKPVGPGVWFAGTPLYMAPELSDPEALIDHRADLYSLGIMAFELLCRKPPFLASSWSELHRLHRFQSFEFEASESATVPDWLRSIVERLCAKHPADRFPTANAVIEAINHQGGMTYELETLETRESYIFSSRFVDRTLEYARVSDFVARRTAGSPGFPPFSLVAGQSGSGKSRLLREVRHDAQLSQVFFCQGRCFEGSFSAFEPLRVALELLVHFDEARNGEALVRRLGPELTKICPHLGEERGFEPSVPLPQVHKEQARLREAVIDFLLESADVGPFVVCIDDLQWGLADLTELLAELAQRIAAVERRGKAVPIALLGACRDDELAGRPAEAMRDLLRAQRCLEEVKIDRLAAADVGEMLGSMLGAGEPPAAFVDRIARETAGNPFFVEELMRALVERGVVSLAAGSWQVRKEVGEIEIPETVAAVFRRRAAMLDGEQRALLEALAVSGRPTAADVLAHFTGLDSDRVLEALAGLVERRMAQEVPGRGLFFKLLHDRLRETVRGDLEHSTRGRLHLEMARSLEAVFARELEDHVFEIADHYNAAADFLSDSGDRRQACRFNEWAGRKSKRSGSFEAAGRYFRAALSLLPADSWSTDYERTAALSRALMEVEYLGKDLERAEEHWRQHVERARTSIEKAEAYIVKVESLTHLGRVHEAVAVSREGLALLGVRLPLRPGKLAVLRELMLTQWALRAKGVDDLLALAELQDPEKHVLLQLLAGTLAPSFISYRQELFACCVARGVRLIARGGNDPAASYFYVSYYLLRQLVFGNHEADRHLGDLALDLARRYEDRYSAGRARFLLAGFIYPWMRPLPEIREILLQGFEDGMSAGDLLFAGFHLNVLITQQCMYSPSADSTLRLIEEHEDFLERLNNPHTVNEIIALRQMLECLAGRTRSPSSFDDHEFDEADYRRYLLELDDPIPIGFYFLFKLKALFLLGLYEKAAELAPEAERRVDRVEGQFVVAEHAFFGFLASVRGHAARSGRLRYWLRRRLHRKLQLMRRWAASCPANFQHKLRLMEAELARAEGRDAHARLLYAKSEVEASEAGFPLDAILSRELAGRFELECGRDEQAGSRLSEARDGYRDWGAAAKVERLEQEFPGLLQGGSEIGR